MVLHKLNALVMPEWKGGTFIALVLAFGLLNNSILAEEDNECNTQACWDLYHKANSYYQADSQSLSDQKVRKCIVLRTYKACLNEHSNSRCSMSLNYRIGLETLNAEFRINKCTVEGPVYPEGPQAQITESSITPCTFKGRPIYNYCSLFGDPHLVTFNGDQLTCKLEGAWPLIDNDFLTVQVTNTPLATTSKSVTVTQKVTVVIKSLGNNGVSGDFCGSREPVFYHAEVGSLPGTFSDGLREYGEYKSIQVNTKSPGEHVEIYLKYIDSTVIVRQMNGQYLSVSVRIPEEVLNKTITNPDEDILRQLCINSCPATEKVNIAEFMSELSQLEAYQSAQQTCRTIGVTDYFFDSCVFDILMTGEEQFSNMAVSVYEDVKRYSSRQPRWTNRTTIEPYVRPTDKSIIITKPTSSAISSYILNSHHCYTRTILFVYIMHVLTFYFLFR